MKGLIDCHPELKPHLLGNSGFHGSINDYTEAEAVI